jgi:outer membrane protein TolC
LRVDVRRRAWVVALVLGLGGAVKNVQAEDERTLTLDEAVAQGLEKNGAIRVEREDVIAAKAAERGARGVYDPLVKLDTDWHRSTEPVNSTFSGAPPGKSAPTNVAFDFEASVEQRLPTGGLVTLRATSARQTTDGTFSLLSPGYFARVGIELRQPLTVLLPGSTEASKFRIRVAALDRNRAEASLRREITDAVAAVEQAYFTLSAARREVLVREEAVRLAEEQLEQTGIRVQQGVSAEAERAQPRAELERRRGELFASREAVSHAESLLKQLILGDGDPLWTVKLVTAEEAPVEPMSVDLGPWMEKALAGRPEVAAAQAALERRRLEAALAHDEMRPTVDAVASYDRYGFSGIPNPRVGPPPGGALTDVSAVEGGWGHAFGTIGDGGFSSPRVGLEVSLPIGNRTAKAAAAVAASAARQAEAQLAQARNAIRAEVLDAAAALQTADQRIAAARAAKEAAEVQLSAERDRFEAGLSTNFLVLTRQNDLSRARLDEIASVNDYRKARTAVARATGALLEERRIKVEEK